MGSWSEACGFSGLEIAEQEPCYVMLLEGPKHYETHGPYQTFAPLTTLLKGTYDDYGYLSVDDDEEILKLFNLQSGLSLENGQEFSLDMLDGRGEVSRFWIHGSIFDRLGELKQEFPYVYINNESQKVNSIGEALDLYDANWLATFEKGRATIAEIQEDYKDRDDSESAYQRELRMEITMMRLEQSSSYTALPVMKFYNKHQEELLTQGADPKAFFAARRRNTMLAVAAAELRKKIVPSEGIGPQHSGEVASVQFANIIIDVQKDRRPEEDEE